jgi:hypothetical protein
MWYNDSRFSVAMTSARDAILTSYFHINDGS